MQTDGEEYESDDGDVDKKVYEYDSEENEVSLTYTFNNNQIPFRKRFLLKQVMHALGID